MTQRCGHPLAARKVHVDAKGRYSTLCWACVVEANIKAGRSPGTKRENA